MKKLMLISATFLLLLTLSCRSDDDNSDGQMNLKGSWRPDKIMTVTTQNGGSTTSTVITDNCQQKSRIVFSTETSGNITYYDTINGECGVLIATDLIYSFNSQNNAFSITTNGNKMEGGVTTLSNTQLNFYYIDKGNPNVTNRVEISATRVSN